MKNFLDFADLIAAILIVLLIATTTLVLMARWMVFFSGLIGL